VVVLFRLVVGVVRLEFLLELFVFVFVLKGVFGPLDIRTIGNDR